MSTVRMVRSRPRSRRPALRAAAGLTLVVATLASCKVDTAIPLNCGGVNTQKVSSDASPDSVAPGGVVTNRVTLGEIDSPLAIGEARYHFWLPDQLRAIESVTFGPGLYHGSYAVRGREMVITFTAGAERTERVPFDTFVLTGRVDPKAPGGTMHWPAPFLAAFDLPEWGGTPQCEVAAGAPDLNNTQITGPSDPAWTAPPRVRTF